MCNREITGVYIGDMNTGKAFCETCIRSALKNNKYNHQQILEMHERGASDKAIANHIGTNPLTVGMIIRKEKIKVQNETDGKIGY